MARQKGKGADKKEEDFPSHPEPQMILIAERC